MTDGGRIAVTGFGMVSAQGWSADEAWDGIEHGRDGLAPLSMFRTARDEPVPAGQVNGDPAERSGLDHGSRSDHLAVCAARQAFEGAGLGAAADALPRETGVVLGACTGGMLDSERFLEQALLDGTVDMELLRHHECASTTNAVARALSLSGPVNTVSTACTSGAAAIALACDWIADGEADVVLAGGVDSLTRLTVNGFSSLLIVAPDGCRPFDADRKGMSLGEGAGVLVLEREDDAIRRGARIRGYVLGAACTCDAHHATAPSPDGDGIQRAMRSAMDAAGVTPDDIGYINAHGTGTPDNDAVEGKAILEVFAGGVPPVSSTKRFFGHTLAAAGAIEAVLSLLAIEKQRIPANLGCVTPDPEIGLEPLRETRDAAVRYVVSNSLGFGGNNASLVLAGVSAEGAGQ
ncbi:MAG: beta-ketoacyl-[acyl-carrier-protein] synthase family protein [bacterium]|nr:beta-ketoacyl-[acyl-carrier-protein] synthase family protein [bacterium]